MRGFFGVLGVAIGLFSSLFVAVAIAELAGAGSHKTPTSILIGIVVFFGASLGAGAYLAWRMLRVREPQYAAQKITHRDRVRRPVSHLDVDMAEKRVLAHFARFGGRATIAEAAARCGLTIAESRAVLENLVSQGAAELLVAEDGTFVYSISGFLTTAAKARAADPLAS